MVFKVVLQLRREKRKPRPKLHQLFHIVNNIEHPKKLLSCFVLERKHRTTKRAALFVFRRIDNTVVRDMVNRQCEAVKGNDETLYKCEYLVAPKKLECSGAAILFSKSAVLRCGGTRAGDIVYLKDGGGLGRIIDFWSATAEDAIAARISEFAPNLANRNRWTMADTTRIVDASDILDAVVWKHCEGNEIHIIVPFRGVLSDLL